MQKENLITSKETKKGLSNSKNITKKLKVPKLAVYENQDKKLIYDESEEIFDPQTDCPFNEGQFAPFFLISDTFDTLSTIKGKNSQEKKKEIISNLFLCFIENAPEELSDLYFFCTGRLESEYIQPDLGVGNEIMMKGSADSVGMKIGVFRKGVKEVGDLGKYVEIRKKTQSTLGNFFGVKGKKDKDEDSKRITVSTITHHQPSYRFI